MFNSDRDQPTSAHEVRVAIIGGGLSGIGTAIALRRAGVDDVVVLERASEVGGTWRDNTYPGCACDVPSTLYSFSFAPNPAWGRMYATQPEIRAYTLDVARRHGVLERVRTNADVLDARWDESAQRWHVETTQGTWTAHAVVSATGPWSEPVFPEVPGLDDFAGTVFHSSRWDHEHPFEGARVAVIGTGASAVQFVPEIRRQAEQVTVFQRTAQWVMPKLDRGVTRGEQALFRRVPSAQRALRAAMYWAFELGGFAERNPRTVAPIQRIARWNLSARCATPSFGAYSRPTTSSAASGSSSPTTGTRR